MTLMKSIRRKLGISQMALAAIAGVNQSTVSRWERGELEPSLTEARRIIRAAAGKVSERDFFPSSTEEAA